MAPTEENMYAKYTTFRQKYVIYFTYIEDEYFFRLGKKPVT